MTLDQYQTMLGSGVSGGYEGPFTPGYINWTALPGYDAFWRDATGNGDNYQEAGLRLPELYQYLDQNGIRVQEDRLPDRQFTRYAVDASGNPIEATRITGRDDSFGDIMGDVAKLAAIMGTAYLGGTALAGSGSAGSSLGSLGNVTQVGTPLAELGAAGVPTAEVGLPGLLAPEATVGSAFTPSMNYGPGMTGAQTSVYDAVVGATGSPGLANTAANVTGPLSSAAEWMKANPTAGRLLMSGVSGLLSASGGSSGGSGGYKDSGYRPTITRGGWQPSVTPRSMALTPTSINLPTTGQPNSGLWRYGLLGG